MTDFFDHFTNNDAEINSTHKRWIRNRSRGREGAEYPDSWAYEQCGGCRFWIPLAGKSGYDWGACAHPRSPFDGQVRFEHDGCDEFTPAGQWITPEDFPYS